MYWECVVTGVAAKPSRRVRLDADPRRQCFGLQHLCESLTLRLADGLIGHFAQPVGLALSQGRDYGLWMRL